MNEQSNATTDSSSSSNNNTEDIHQTTTTAANTPTIMETMSRSPPIQRIIEKRRRRRNERIANRNSPSAACSVALEDDDNSSSTTITTTTTTSIDNDNDAERNNDNNNNNRTLDSNSHNDNNGNEKDEGEPDESCNNDDDEQQNCSIQSNNDNDDGPNDEGGTDDHDDVVGELRSTPFFFQRLSTRSIGQSSPPSSEQGDYIPPESTPGAFWQHGRPVGDLPAWFSTFLQRRSPPAATSSNANIPRVRSNNNNNNNNERAFPVVFRRVNSDGSSGEIQSSSLSPSVGSNLNRMAQLGSSQRSLRSSGSRSTSTDSSQQQQQQQQVTRRGISRTGSLFRMRNSIRNLRNFIRRTSSSILPEAEILDAEKVVYAEVQERHQQNDIFCSWELTIYTLVVLLLGIIIGRLSTTIEISNGISSVIG